MPDYDYYRLEFDNRPPSYMRWGQGDKFPPLEPFHARFAIKVDEAEYLRNTTMIDRWIISGWAKSPYDDMIAEQYEKLHGGPPGSLPVFNQLKSIFNAFDDYRACFGEWDDVHCGKCQNFLEDGTTCIYCEDDESE